MNVETRRWLAFAQEDLRTAELVLTEEIYNQVCFHAQQAVEKTLKGFLLHRDGSTPRTHSIADLLRLLSVSWFTEITTGLNRMDSYYTPTRYPDAPPGSLPEGMPDLSDAQEALETAQEVYRLTLLAFEQNTSETDEPSDA
ncbi:MAG: HEPN domain-containing protein [Chloroflexi bacterium]|nr:HEPN domain-containing protein [Chloroflexota bacterium]